jgi:endonuclease YncB( thermonuclease family)
VRVALLVFAALLIGCEAKPGNEVARDHASTQTSATGPTQWQVTSIVWDDADSGRINGVRFRLHDVDAPEIGAEGAVNGVAHCSTERALGSAARAWVQVLTRAPAVVRITNTYGYDRREPPRLLIDLSANGLDIGREGIETGHMVSLPHFDAGPHTPRHVWCDEL